MNFIIVPLCVGFIITVIFLWVYGVPPGRIEKKDKPVSSNNWEIASYISFVVIVALFVLNALNAVPKQDY